MFAPESGFARSSYFSDVKAPLVKNPSFASPPRIVTTHYAGTGSFEQSVSVSWRKNPEGAFTSGVGKRMTLVGFRLDELVISQQQDFSMMAMVKTNYLTPEQALMFRNLGSSLEPGQVVFSEVIRDATPNEIRQNYGDELGLRRAGSHTEIDAFRQDLTPVKTAAAWSVSGQTWDRHTGKAQAVRLPWEKEEARKGQELNRKKYPYVFEWGRAAQEVSGEIAPLYSLNALQNYLQLKAYRGNLEDAYVMAHSFDPVNTRLYARMTNDGYYPSKAAVDPKDALFIMPLALALESHPPSRVSQRVADLVKLGEGHLSEINSVNLLIENRERRWAELDYSKNGQTQATPIVLNDMSMARVHSLWGMISAFPISQANKNALLEKLLSLDGETTLLASNFEGKYENVADAVRSSFVSQKKNAVEISNLDPAMAAADAQYAKSVLYASYMYQAQRIAVIFRDFYGLSTEASLGKASDMIHELDIQFGVTTHSPVIAEQLKKLNPQGRVFLPKTEGAKPSKDDIKENPQWYRDAEMFFFSAEQIIRWGFDDRAFAVENGRLLRPGRWQTQYFLAQPDLF